MAQIISITSEALQATIRRLLPSQQGFGEDLQATNVVTPIIDLTPSAEGSSVPSYLQTALAFGSQNTFNINDQTSTIIATGNPGFWQITGVSANRQSTTDQDAKIDISDGFTSKTLFNFIMDNSNDFTGVVTTFDFVLFLRPQDNVTGICSFFGRLNGSYRQIADSNGNLVNPVGFTPQ